MLQLPIRVHDAWRGEFERRWKSVRILLIVGFGIIPVATVVAGLVIVTALGVLDRDATTLWVAAIEAFIPLAYLWSFLFRGKVGKDESLWGGKVCISGAFQSLGVLGILLNAPRELTISASLEISAAVFTLSILGGVAAWRAHAIMFTGPDEALAATSLPIRERGVAYVPPVDYTGRLYITDGYVRWDLRWWYAAYRGERGGARRYKSQVSLHEITDARIVPISQPGQVPPLATMTFGKPVYPQRGELLLVRTSQGEVGIPAKNPHRVYHLLNLRCSVLNSIAAAQPE